LKGHLVTTSAARPSTQDEVHDRLIAVALASMMLRHQRKDGVDGAEANTLAGEVATRGPAPSASVPSPWQTGLV
jgi:hypothetical protein